MRRRQALYTLLALLVAPLSAGGPGGEVRAASLTEYQVKASMLYNFQRYVEWPSGSPPGMTLCVLGQDPFGEDLAVLAGRPAKGQPLAVRHIQSVGEAGGCHLLFIARSEFGRIDRIVHTLREHPVLTIADSEGAASRGVMIELFMEARHVAFRINLEAARGVGLHISSQVLKLAREVYQ